MRHLASSISRTTAGVKSMPPVRRPLRNPGVYRGALGMGAFFFAPFVLLLYLHCSFPYFSRSRDPYTDTADTSARNIKKLSDSAITVLQYTQSNPIANVADKEALNEYNNSATDVKAVGDLGSSPSVAPVDLSRMLNVEDMRFTVENHGYQVLIYSSYARNFKAADKDEISWVTQLTVDRIPSLEKMLERWDGPVSAALYSRNVAFDVREIEKLRDRVDFHIVGASQGLYPVNTLRNIALNKARGDHVLLADVDFIPSVGLYKQIKGSLEGWRALYGEQAVYVLPAFQMDKPESQPPRDKPELIKMGKEIHQVHNEPARSIAHKPTDYDRWMKATEVYQAEYKFPYEPYFLAPKTIPRYDVRFYGYGNDKASHGYELDKAGFVFKVLPDAFVVHAHHPQGSWVKATFLEPKDRMNQVLVKFLADVDRRYGRKKFRDKNVVFDPLPPAAGFEPVGGLLGEECDETCNKTKGKVCVAEWSERVNNCKALEQYHNCMNGCDDNFFGSDLPAFNSQREQCLINNDPNMTPFVCNVKYQYSRRLCPCGNKDYVAVK